MKRFSLGVMMAMSVLVVHQASALDVTVMNSGDWSSTTPDAPWPGGVLPGTNDSVEITAGVVITVDVDATIGFLYGDGAALMSPDVTLTVLGDTAGAYGTHQLASFDASAAGNTVIYRGNSFWAKRTDYYNLEFAGAGDFYNGPIPGSAAVPMHIAGNMTLSGTNVAVQQGADISINGNLSMLGATNKWDTSSFNLVVGGDTSVTGTRALLVDLDGASGTNIFEGNVTVGPSALAWNVSDVIQWSVGGSLTNLGLIAGRGYGSITFAGNGVIGGNPITLPTITVSGSYLVGTTITLLTNTPTLTGTLIFDLAMTNKLMLRSYPTNLLTLYYDSNLEVVNSGAAPTVGSVYTFFGATNFDGTFTSISLPTLDPGLSWSDQLLTSGSFAVVGDNAGSPILIPSAAGSQLTLTWDSDLFPGYHIQVQTNAIGIGGDWIDTPSGTVSPYVTGIDPANTAVFYRLAKP